MKHAARRSLLAALALAALALPGVSSATRTRRTRTPAPGPARMCTATLVVPQTSGAESCFIDERVTRAPGTLRYPCDGGAAVADFGGSRFTGTVRDGVVALSLTTRFHYSDGCDWQSAQEITGTLAARQLAYRYAEAPVPGQRGCASSCRAGAVVTVR